MSERLAQALSSGLLYGALYGLMALGLTLAWGALRLLNLAHGALYLAGAYVGWACLEGLRLPLPLALAAGVGAAALLGLGLQRIVLRPLLGRPGWDNATLVATLGVAIVCESLALLIFGPRVKQLPPVGGPDAHRLVLVATAVACLGGLGLFLRRSRHGLAIRAVAQNRDAARLVGIAPGRVFALVMALSGGLAGLAGLLLSSVLYLSPGAGFAPMLSALVVTILGGLGSIRGTLLAALGIGLVEALIQVYAGAAWALPGMFLLVIVVLTVRPQGLFGLREGERL